jgi:hypothetical protein
MSDFQWTDELVSEACLYAGFAINTRTLKEDVAKQVPPLIQKFKEEHTKPKVEWEIVKMINNDGWVHDSGAYGFPCKEENCKIHSVRRLSDGEVFSLGDDVECMGRVGKIIKLDTSRQNDGFYVDVQYDKISSYHNKELSGIKKVTKLPIPLFKTEDGVEVFENDRAWWVDKYFSTDFYDFTVSSDRQNDLKHYPKDYKYFSKKEAAEEYILLHKPLLSVNDVMKLGGKWWIDESSLGNRKAQISELALIEKAKEKLSK